MHWSGYAIKGFALGAGFPSDVLAGAVAVAWVVSEGDDHWFELVGDPPVFDRRGLWGVDLVAHPEYEHRNLFDPRQNARVAYDLWVGSGGTFAWCPDEVIVAAARYGDEAKAIVADPRRDDQVPFGGVRGTVRAAFREAWESADSMARGIAQGPIRSV